MSGLLIGILLARTVSGAIAGLFGWRTVFWLATAATLALAATLYRALPREMPPARVAYGRLLASLIHLARTQPGLRQAALTGATLFAAFSVFWTTVTFYLAGPPWHLGGWPAALASGALLLLLGLGAHLPRRAW